MSLLLDEVLFYYDYPLVISLKDMNSNSFHICSAIDKESDHNLFYFGGRISEKNLELLKLGIIDLREAIKNPIGKEWRIYFPKDKQFNEFKLDKKKFNRPIQEYLPESDFYIKEEITGDLDIQKISIDGLWEVQDFGNLFKRFSQAYSFFYITSDQSYIQKNFVGHIKNLKRDIKSGFDSLHFFREASDFIPLKNRITVDKMQFASPGYLDFKASKIELEKTYKTIKKISNDILNIEAKYFNYYRTKSKINSNKDLNPQERNKLQSELQIETLNYFANEIFEINLNILSELSTDKESAIKLLFSVFRKIIEIVILAEEGKINFSPKENGV